MLAASAFPYLEVEISIGTWSTVAEVYLDTGLEGGLLIPEHLEPAILASPAVGLLKIANEELVEAAFWTGRIEFGGVRFLVEIAAMGTRFLLGREILDQLDIRFEFGKRTHITFRS